MEDRGRGGTLWLILYITFIIISSTNYKKYDMAKLEVDLLKIIKNYKYASSLLCNNSKLGAVLKANAYGLGALPIAQKLYNTGCEDFYVANLEEAIELRKALPLANIFVLNGLKGCELLEGLYYSVIPVANSVQQVNDYHNYAKRFNQPIDMALHVDTGMCRLGITVKELDKILQSKLCLNILNVMSHFSCASEPEHPMNLKQLSIIKSIKKKYPFLKFNCANSPAILMGEQYHFDYARIGAGLYGVNPFASNENPFINVVTLKSSVIHKRIIEDSCAVSYGATHYAKRGDKIIIADMGYADSIPTLFSNKGMVHYYGKYLPIIGRVTMDMTIIDASILSDALFEKIQEVEFIGDNLTLEMISNNVGVFNYEILATLGNRIKRYYIGANG